MNRDIFRKIPQVDSLSKEECFKDLNKKVLLLAIKESLKALREKLKNGALNSFEKDYLIRDIKKIYDKKLSSSLVPLINATGIILHTNMGRSPISENILKRASKVICGYSNLEYNIQKGTRGQRYDHARDSLSRLLGCEDALIVNNNASAVFLILNTFAKNKEVVVSRGELVEIGGSFRIPEVMKHSGAILKEVGTTNKTRISDYENEITQNSAMLMKVHKSNFSIEGFYEEATFSEIKELCKKYNLLDYYDLGSGYIPNLPYNLSQKEPPLQKIIELSPSLISFSGDKLFGSVQAGIIAGKKELISKLKKNQLLRMLRVDKIILSILEESTKAYLKEEYEDIPTLNLLFQTVENLSKRAKKLCSQIGKDKCEIVESTTFMGGGTLPNRKFPTVAVHIKGDALKLEKDFREKHLIGRIENDKFLIDLRSIFPKQDEQVAKLIMEVIR